MKCLEAIISNRRDLLVEIYGNVCPVLVSRFKEREENVKSDIFLAFVALLRQTKPPHSSALDLGTNEDPAVTRLKNQVQTECIYYSITVSIQIQCIGIIKKCHCLITYGLHCRNSLNVLELGR